MALLSVRAFTIRLRRSPRQPSSLSVTKTSLPCPQRRLREISASTWCFAGTGLDGVIPLGMEGVAFDVEGRHFGVADSDALFIGIGVEFAADRQSRLGCGRRDQLDDRRPAGERPATPILRDVAEQAVVDLVPLGCAGRVMAGR